METCRRDLYIDIIDEFILKNNRITFYPCFTFIPKTGESFKCDGHTSYYQVGGKIAQNWRFKIKYFKLKEKSLKFCYWILKWFAEDI